MNPLTHVFLDMDGTIMGYTRPNMFEPPDVYIEPEVISLLNELEFAGVGWSVNSGRDVNNQRRIIEHAVSQGLRHMPASLLCCESYVYVRNGDTYGALNPWNTDASELLVRFHRNVQNNLARYMDEWLSHITRDNMYMHEEGSAMLLDLADTELFNRIYSEFSYGVEQTGMGYAFRNSEWVSSSPFELGKGNILMEACRSLGLDLTCVLAIGDHLNDVTMLDGKSAGMVGCPGDAAAEVQELVCRAGGYVGTQPGPAGTCQVIRTHIRHLNLL